MLTYLTVVPAYGRDYTSAKSAKADWHDGKDFVVMDMSSPYDGKYISKRDVKPGMRIMIRYNGKTKICNV